MSALPSSHKRPRGLWKGRREAVNLAEPEVVIDSHDADYELLASSSHHSGDSLFDDDLDDSRSAGSSAKRRRLSGALSDTETLCHQSPASRSLTPDFSYYHAPCFPVQLPNYYSPLLKLSSVAMDSVYPADKYASINRVAKGKQPLTSDMEDWENLKELFARASESYDCDEMSEALPLLRAVIRECHRFLLAHPDPSLVFTESHPLRDSKSPEAMTPTEERLVRDWTSDSTGHSSRCSNSTSSSSKSSDSPTAFHAIFGAALFFMGTIIAQDSTLALPDEPSNASTYWLAALDVFETGENTPSVMFGRGDFAEDWRMAVSWGRTLLCIADEKLEHSLHGSKGRPTPMSTVQTDFQNSWCAYQPPTAGPFSASEPRWPKSSPFHAIAAARPPVTRRMSLFSATAHDVMVLAMDQFSRGIFHMPHPHYPHTHNPSGLQLESPFVDGTGFSSAFHSRRHTVSCTSPPPTTSTLTFSRPKELFTIASEVLGIAERLSKAEQREYWAGQADSVFNQMKMEADMAVSRMAVNAARGRCWLVVGEARAEDLEGRLEKGEVEVLMSAEAEEAREGLAMAIAFFERAKGSATAKCTAEQEDLSPLLAEALVTLANLTADENKREELYARAQAEGGEDVDLELDPPQIHTPTFEIVMDEVNVNMNLKTPTSFTFATGGVGIVMDDASTRMDES